jgi:hypothetical protein
MPKTHNDNVNSLLEPAMKSAVETLKNEILTSTSPHNFSELLHNFSELLHLMIWASYGCPQVFEQAVETDIKHEKTNF